MGSYRIGINRIKTNKRLVYEVFDVIYDKGLSSQYIRQFSTKLDNVVAVMKKDDVVKSDTFQPTTWGASSYLCTSPVGVYKGPRYGGFAPAEPINFTNPPIGDEFGYGTRFEQVDAATILSWSDNDMNNVTTRAMAKFGADEFHAGIYLAESIETGSYLADKATTLFKMVAAVRKGNVSALRKAFGRLKGKKITARNTSGELSKRWLEYRYAVMPIFNDTAALVNMFHNGIDHNRRDESRKWELVTSAVLKKDGYKTRVDPVYYNYKCWHKLTYYCKLWATIDDAKLYAKSKIGINSIAAPLWELVPFSFVWDWMMPIGTLIQALTSTSGLAFSRGFKRFVVDTHAIVEQTQKTGVANRDPSCKLFTVDRKGFVRLKLSKFPTPMVFTKSPFSTDNVITAAALFRVLFIKN